MKISGGEAFEQRAWSTKSPRQEHWLWWRNRGPMWLERDERGGQPEYIGPCKSEQGLPIWMKWEATNGFKQCHKSESEVAQSCLCDPMDCSLTGSSVHGIFQAIVLEWIAISFSRGIFLTQGLNPGLPHCRQMLYRLSHQGSQSTDSKNKTGSWLWLRLWTPYCQIHA